jgi:hypothetical protein
MLRAYGRASAERAATRAWAGTDRKNSRPGTAVAVPAVLRKGPGRGVDKMEGVGHRARRAADVNGLAQMDDAGATGQATERHCQSLRRTSLARVTDSPPGLAP